VALCAAHASLQVFGASLVAQLGAWDATERALLAAAPQDAEWPLRAADDFLLGVGHALMAWAWARIARAAADGRHTPLARSADSWLESARHGIDWLLPQAQVHWQRAQARGAALPFVRAFPP
jgi:hypothetical protein